MFTCRPYACALAALLALPAVPAFSQEARPRAADPTRAGETPSVPTPASGTVEPGSPAGEPEPSPFSVELRGGGRITFRGDLRDSPGSVSIDRAEGGLGLGWAIDKQLRLSLDFDTEFSWYDFNGASGLIPGTTEPFRRMSTYRLGPAVTYAMDENWSFRAGGLFDWSQEGDGPRGNGFTGGGIVAVRYAFSKDLALSGGLVASSRLAESARFFPIIGVEWQINDTLRFETTGPGAVLSAKLAEAWSVFIDGGYEDREFRLKASNLLPEGVIRDRRILLGAGVKYQPAPRIEISLRGGAVVWSEYRVDDRRGNQLRTVETQATPYIGLSASIGF